jgi:hypothetical protein
MAESESKDTAFPSGTGSNDARMASIMKVDTEALLQTIVGIEKALSDYKKPGDVPKWAAALTARLELVERVANKTPRPEPAVGTSGGMQTQTTLASVAQEEKLLVKLRVEMAQTLSASSLTMESKISTMTLELDRLQKLLAIRPTTSELQQVVLSIHDMNRKLQDSVHDIQKNVRMQVHSVVAEETSNILASVQSSIDLNSQSIGLIAKKVDGYNSDITSIRKGTEAAVENQTNHIKQCQFDTQASKELVLQLEAQMESDGAKVEQALANLKFQDDMAVEKIEEVKAGIGEKLAVVQKAMDANEALVKSQVAETSAIVLSMQSIVDTTKKDIDDFRFTYEVDTKAQLEENKKILGTMAEMTERNAEMSEYVSALKAFDVIKAIELAGELQASMKATQDDADSNISNLSSKLGKVQKAMTKVEESMEKLPGMVDAVVARMDHMATEAQDAKDALDKTTAKLEAALLRLAEMDELKEQMELLKAAAEESDKKSKQQQSSIMSLLEVTSDHEGRLEHMTELIDNSDAIVEQKMLKMQAEIIDNVAAKQAEVEALVANMQENIEVMSLGLGGDGGSQSSGKPGAMGTAGGARGGFSRKAGGAAMGMGANGAGGAAGAGGGLAAMGGGGTGGGGMSEEAHEVMAQSSNFIADLCINFEEIAVRKSYVNDIPSAMCENIATTAQSLAQLIAHTTDSEAVQMALRGDSSTVEYDDALVSSMRQKKVEGFLESVFSTVHGNHDKPGAVRLDARKAFMQSLRKALDLCMSKHDQVLVVSNSRFGRVKVASCIACDRPLLDKVRQTDRVKAADNGPPKDFPQLGHGSIDDSLQSNSMVGGILSGSPVPRNKTRGPAKSIKLPQTNLEKIVRPNSSHGAEEAAALRGAFKSPKPGRSAFTSNENQLDGGLPELRQSHSQDTM